MIIEQKDHEDQPQQTIVLMENGLSLLDINHIVRLEALSNYTRIFLANGKKIVVAKTLKYFAEQLQATGFVRCHRAHLVKSDYIEKMLCNSLLLSNGESIEISRRKKAGLRSVLKDQLQLRMSSVNLE